MFNMNAGQIFDPKAQRWRDLSGTLGELSAPSVVITPLEPS